MIMLPHWITSKSQETYVEPNRSTHNNARSAEDFDGRTNEPNVIFKLANTERKELCFAPVLLVGGADMPAE
jgi:hypothetical protein